MKELRKDGTEREGKKRDCVFKKAIKVTGRIHRPQVGGVS